jgi:hypothetical protein
MQDLEEYLARTETATKLLFEGVAAYRVMLKEAVGTTTFSSSYADHNDLEAQYTTWRQDNGPAIARAEYQYNLYFAETFSNATLCGSILQIASKGIEKYSKNDLVPEDVQSLVGNLGRAKRFCIGRRVRDLPIGLIVYAGRNQHMHFEEGTLQAPSRQIFHRLATAWDKGRNEVKDPAFNPENPTLDSLAHNVVGLLGWRTYEDFTRDMADMLS